MSLQIQIGADVSGIDRAITDASRSIDRIKPAALSGAASLNALGQVARDAPFGFIAIQNNLPILFDQFGALTKASGSLSGAFKAVGSALVGPVGVTFAIGALISGITVLVQKYGSVGAALDAIFSKQSKYNEQILESTKSLEKFNKEKRTGIDITNQEASSVQGTIARVQSLGKIVTDVTKSYNERNSALNALKDIDKDHFGNLDIEKTKFSDLKIAVDNYTQSIKQAAITKGFEAAIGETSVELAKQFKLLNNLKDELEAAKRAPVKFIGKADQVDTRDIDAATERFNEQNAIVNALRGEIALYNTEIDKSVQAQNAIQAPIDAANKKLAEQKKALKEAQKESAKLSIGQITEGVQLNNGVITSDIALLTRVTEANVRLTNLAVDRIRRYRDKNLKDITGIKPLDLIPKKIDKTAAVPMSAELQNQVGTTLLELDKLSTKFTQTSQALQSAFFEPLTSAFTTFFETGKIGFKEFGKSIIKTIQQIVAKIIATGIINLLASILSGGSTSAIGGVASATKGINIGKSFGDAFKSVLGLGGNRVAAPSFSGVGSGGLQMSGQVVFVQRGSDLVGVLNRTNGTINRVG